jgi:hypothetical protein
MSRQQITVDDSLTGARVIVRRDITAMRPTREYTGGRNWEGVVTDATRDAQTGELAALCVQTAKEHTWIAVGTWDDGCGRRWATTAEFPAQV